MNHETLCRLARLHLPDHGITHEPDDWTSYSVGPRPYRLFVHRDHVGWLGTRRYELQLNASDQNLDALRAHPAVEACVHATELGLGGAGPHRRAVLLWPDAAEAHASSLVLAALTNWYDPQG